jgi:hypothetical protein
MSRPARTPEQFRAVTDHLLYEIQMFDTTARTLTAGLFGPGIATNAFLESFAIHSRALVQFFYAKSPQADDVIAEDFFPEAHQWQSLRGALPDALTPVSRRVGKELAHLTYARLDVTPEAKRWDIRQVWESLSGVIDLFIQNVDREKLGPAWPNPTQ